MEMEMKMKMNIAGFIIIGISILCQQNNCDELSTTTLSPSTTSLVSSTGKLENKDLTTPSTLQSTASSFPSTKSAPYTTLKQTVESSNLSTRSSDAVETKTSITSTSTTVTHSLRVDRVEAGNDEILIDATTSLDGICLPKSEGEQSYSVESIDGDIMVTTITSQQSSINATDLIKFIARRVNDIDLLVNGVTIGVRVVQVFDQTNLEEILELESVYLENCVKNPFGIFLSFELWNSELLKEKNFEFKVWPLPSVDDVRARKIAQLLDEFPISPNQTNLSVEIKTDSMERRLAFESILKNESLCFSSSTSDASADKIIIYNGNAKFLSSIRRNGNETLFVVPSSNIEEIVMSEVPNESLIAFESEIEAENLRTLPSQLIVVSATFLEICKSINNAIWKNCKQAASPAIKINLTRCEIFNDLQVSEPIPTTDIKQMLKLLKLDIPPWDSQLTFDVYKKFTSHTNQTSHSSELKRIAATNYVTNITTFYIPYQTELIPLGSRFSCDRKNREITTEAPTPNKSANANSSQNAIESQSRQNVDTKFELNDKFPPELNSFDLNSETGEEIETYNWQVRSEIWVAIGLTVATLGILLSIAILTFILVRVCMEDVLEGNPIGSILLLLALIAQFASFFPFTIEYSGFRRDHYNTQTAIEIFNSMCTIRIFVVSVCYCLTFSLLLSRAIMLASIGSEGGFLSHVNGYIQSIICIFSFLVQLGLSTQLLILMHANQKHVTCENVYYGNWFWAIVGYDGMLLLMLVGLSPFIFRSQRNYQEGILLVITALLCFVCWLIWIPLSSINNNFREMAVPLGVQATGWIILASLMVPRCFLIVRSIARSDFTQALPSLTSLAFAQANQYNSEPSLYECVNPAMRQQSNDDSLGHHTHHATTVEGYLSPSEVPTLPMRSGSARRNFIEHYNNNIQFNEIVNPDLHSTPNKMTRF